MERWVALSLCKHLGGKTFRNLLDHFNDDLTAILAASEADLRQVRGIGAKIATAIQQIDLPTTIEAIIRWQHNGVNILTWDMPHYPPALKALEDAPPTLFVLGQIPINIRACAIVGTRNPSPAGREIAQRLAVQCAEQGEVVVSGLALGIDTEAHMGTLAVPAGQPLAVLGSGILNIYPPANRTLASAIQRRGALICEVAPDATVSTPGLVARNRLITGLCERIIIVETELDGGAMHAARFAKAQGKPLYAVDNSASGNRHLIQTHDAIAL